jgi:hypothetical protein
LAFFAQISTLAKNSLYSQGILFGSINQARLR